MLLVVGVVHVEWTIYMLWENLECVFGLEELKAANGERTSDVEMCGLFDLNN